MQIAAGQACLRVAFGDGDIADRDAWERDHRSGADGRAGNHRIAPVVTPGEAEATGGHRRNSRVEVGQLPGRSRVVAVDRPHGEHPQPLGPGKYLEAIGILQGEDLTGDVVDAEHRRHAQLVPAERLPLGGKQRGQLREGGVGSVDGILAHRFQ